MNNPDSVDAYRRMRALLRRAGLTLAGLQSQLAQAGLSYSYDSITSWGRINRGFPRNPHLLATIVRILAVHLPASPQTTRELGLFLRAAGYPARQLQLLADVLDFEALTALFAAAPELFLPGQAPAPAPLPEGSRPPPFGAFHGFRGRDDLLSAIAAQMRDGRHVLLSGIGGIGKTMLAAEFAYRYGRYFLGGMFWLNADSPGAFWQEVSACGSASAMALAPEFERLPPENQRRMVLARWAEATPRLLILDNLEDPELITQLHLPDSGCRLLISSQLAALDPALNVRILTVPPLRREDSIALLQAEIGGTPDDATELDAIAATAGDVPLALHLAGQLLAREGFATAAQISAVLSDPSFDAGSLRSTPSSHSPLVAATIQRSISRLEPDEPSDLLARLLLVCAAHCAPGAPLESELLLTMAGTPPEVAGIGSDERLPLPDAPPRARRAIQRLIDLGLIERGTGNTLRLHRLVAAVARELPEAVEARRRAELCMLLAGRQRVEHANQLRKLLPHQEHLVQHATGRTDRLALLLRMDLGWNLVLLHMHDAAWEHLREVLAIFSAQQGADHPDTVEARIRLGLCYQFAGDMLVALPIWEEVVTSIRRRQAEDIDTYARELVNAGTYFFFYGDLQRAEPLLREALALRRSHLPLLHEGIARNLRNLAMVYLHSGRLRQARRYGRLAIAIFDQLGQQVSLVNMYACWVLGEIYLELAEWQAAEQHIQRAIDGYVELFATPGTSPTEVYYDAVANCLRLLALIDFQRSQRDSARRRLEAALHIARMTVGEQGYPTAFIQRDLARLDLVEGRYLAALERSDAALTALRNRVGADHVESAGVLHVRGRIEAARGQLAQAQATLNEALAMLRRLTDGPHQQAGQILHSLGEVALQAGDAMQSSRHFEAALHELQATTPRHPLVASCVRYLMQKPEAR